MTERERLIELIKQGDKNFADNYEGKVMSHIDEVYEFVADHLLANGVIVPPSEHVYFIVDKGTKYAMVMPKRTDELPLYKLRDLEKYGYYLSKEEAEKHL